MPSLKSVALRRAAGVLKYKTRKKELESKLNQTQNNLDRLEDIIYELDGQVKPLKSKQRLLSVTELDEERRQTQLNLFWSILKLVNAT